MAPGKDGTSPRAGDDGRRRSTAAMALTGGPPERGSVAVNQRSSLTATNRRSINEDGHLQRSSLAKPDKGMLATAGLANIVFLKKKMPGVLAKARDNVAGGKSQETFKAHAVPPSLHRSSVLDAMALSNPLANVPSGPAVRTMPSVDEAGSSGATSPFKDKARGRQSTFGLDVGLASPMSAPAASVGAKELMAVSKAKRAGRLFLRLGGPQSRVDFLKVHPFFQDTSNSLRERLAPQLVRRSVEHVCSDIIRQGEEPQGSTDYLFLTSLEFTGHIEVILNGQAVAVLCGGAVFGQEAIFGITKQFSFGIRVPTDSVALLWVIPRKMLQSLLSKEGYQKDAVLLKERAHTNAVSLLRTWYLHPISHLKLRLFDNAEHAFKHRLAQAAEMRLCSAGSYLCREGEAWKQAFCVFHGEAHVTIAGNKIARLAHCVGMSAWAAWWGTLEVTGVCDKCPASVMMVSDCIVWLLSPEWLANLRLDFPMECSLFDKVAHEHVKLLQSHAMKVQESSLAGACRAEFLEELDASAENRTHKEGSIVVQEGECASANEIYIIARGSVEVRRSLGGDLSQYVPVASLHMGDWFGEVAALGIRDMRTATVICSTVCDFRVVTRTSMLKALVNFPDQGVHLESLAEQRGYAQNVNTNSQKLNSLPFFSDFSSGFLEKLAVGMSSFAAFTQQLIIDQGQEPKAMFVLLQGKVGILIDDALVFEILAPAVLGEEALLEPGRKSLLTVRSEGLCHFRVITSSVAKEVMEIFPEDINRLKKVASKNLETLRSVLVDRFHGQNLSMVAKRQAGEGLEEDPNDRPKWWTGTLFKESDPRFLQFLSRQQTKLIYFAEEVMIQEGDEGDYALIIEEGQGVVEVGGLKVGEIKPGGLVGEAVLLGSAKTRTASVRAVGLVSARTLARTCLQDALKLFPEEMERLEELANLRNMANQILQGGGKLPVGQKLGGPSTGGTLLKLNNISKGGGVDLGGRRKSALGVHGPQDSLSSTDESAMSSPGGARRNSYRAPGAGCVMNLSVGGVQVQGSTVRRKSAQIRLPPPLLTESAQTDHAVRRKSHLGLDVTHSGHCSSSGGDASARRKSGLGAGLNVPGSGPGRNQQGARRNSSVGEHTSAAPVSARRHSASQQLSKPGDAGKGASSLAALLIPSASAQDMAPSPVFSSDSDADSDDDEVDPAMVIAPSFSFKVTPSEKRRQSWGHDETAAVKRRSTMLDTALPLEGPTVLAAVQKVELWRRSLLPAQTPGIITKPICHKGIIPEVPVAKAAAVSTNVEVPAAQAKDVEHEKSSSLSEEEGALSVIHSESHSTAPKEQAPQLPAEQPDGSSAGEEEDDHFGEDEDEDEDGNKFYSSESYAEQFEEYRLWTQQSRQDPEGWARERREQMEVAPLRRAQRLAKRGNFLPLVPTYCGYTEGPPRPEGKPNAAGISRMGRLAGVSRLHKAQSVYLQAQRFDDQRSLAFHS